jgi:hypothetical protein
VCGVASCEAERLPLVIGQQAGPYVAPTIYSLPSETNKYTHVFLAAPVIACGPARGDTEIEKYFDMSVVLIPVDEALRAVGDTITSMETVGALMAAHTELQ